MLDHLKKWVLCTLLCLTATANAYSAPKTVLVLGDSLSAEYGIVRGAGWVALLEQRLRAQRVKATVINASISGETTSGGRTRLPALMRQHRPDFLVIELGANDGLRGLPVKDAVSNIKAMVDLAKQNKTRVLLVGIRLPPNYGAYAESFHAMYPALAKELKVPLVPFMLDGVADQPQLFQADRLHPSAEAHPHILANIWPHFQALIKNR